MCKCKHIVCVWVCVYVCQGGEITWRPVLWHYHPQGRSERFVRGAAAAPPEESADWPREACFTASPACQALWATGDSQMSSLSFTWSPAGHKRAVMDPVDNVISLPRTHPMPCFHAGMQSGEGGTCLLLDPPHPPLSRWIWNSGEMWNVGGNYFKSPTFHHIRVAYRFIMLIFCVCLPLKHVLNIRA